MKKSFPKPQFVPGDTVWALDGMYQYEACKACGHNRVAHSKLIYTARKYIIDNVSVEFNGASGIVRYGAGYGNFTQHVPPVQNDTRMFRTEKEAKAAAKKLNAKSK